MSGQNQIFHKKERSTGYPLYQLVVSNILLETGDKSILLRIYQEKVQEKVLKDSELEALKQFIDDGDADKASIYRYLVTVWIDSKSTIFRNRRCIDTSLL